MRLGHSTGSNWATVQRARESSCPSPFKLVRNSMKRAQHDSSSKNLKNVLRPPPSFFPSPSLPFLPSFSFHVMHSSIGSNDKEVERARRLPDTSPETREREIGRIQIWLVSYFFFQDGTQERTWKVSNPHENESQKEAPLWNEKREKKTNDPNYEHLK